MEAVLTFRSSVGGILKMSSARFSVLTYLDDLALGDIRSVSTEKSRLETARRLHYEMTHDLHADPGVTRRYLAEIRLFYRKIRNFNSLTITYRNTAVDWCNLMYIVWLLRDENVTLYLAPLDDSELGAIIKHGPQLERRRTVLTTERQKKHCETWELLARQNAPMRVLKDQTLLGVDYDYYDGVLLARALSSKTRLGEIIVSLMDEEVMQHGIGFTTWRYDALAKEKKLNVQWNAQDLYQSLLYG